MTVPFLIGFAVTDPFLDYILFSSVHKDPSTKKLQVGSVVLKVSAQVYFYSLVIKYVT